MSSKKPLRLNFQNFHRQSTGLDHHPLPIRGDAEKMAEKGKWIGHKGECQTNSKKKLTHESKFSSSTVLLTRENEFSSSHM